MRAIHSGLSTMSTHSASVPAGATGTKKASTPMAFNRATVRLPLRNGLPLAVGKTAIFLPIPPAFATNSVHIS